MCKQNNPFGWVEFRFKLATVESKFEKINFNLLKLKASSHSKFEFAAHSTATKKQVVYNCKHKLQLESVKKEK